MESAVAFDWAASSFFEQPASAVATMPAQSSSLQQCSFIGLPFL
jgi:hypothetical protein